MREALSRRRLLAGTAALASPLAAVPALAGDPAHSADAELIRAAQAAVALRRSIDSHAALDGVPEAEADDVLDRLLDTVDEHLDVVIARPATTLPGLRAKALAVEDEARHFMAIMFGPDTEADPTDLLLGSLLRDVLALTAIGEGNAGG